MRPLVTVRWLPQRAMAIVASLAPRRTRADQRGTGMRRCLPATPTTQRVSLLGLMATMVVVFLVAVSARATTFSNYFDAGGWRADSSAFECSLIHSVPYYGDAVFHTRAGESSAFALHAESSRLETGQAALVAKSPAWHEQHRQVDLGFIPVKRGLQPIRLPSRYTERMLAELYNGLEIVFTRQPWYGAETSTRVAITTVGFRSAYEQYQQCLAGLLPVNFDQIKRTAIYFDSNQYEKIAPSELRKLDKIALYIKADPSVKEFFIDGHTDSVGTREDNLELAKRRAEEVTRYLINQGIPKDAITSRWHGERYPVATNQSGSGRAKNRRVTIRLEREQAPQAL